MSTYYLIITLIVLLLIAYPLLLAQTINYKREVGKRLKAFGDKDIYQKKDKYLNTSELSLYNVLVKKLPKKYLVVPQASLISFIDVNQKFGNVYDEIDTLRNFRVDFLIIERDSTKPELALELDGKSHELYSRKNRDYYLNNVLMGADMKIRHIKVGADFEKEVDEITKILS